MLNRKIKLAYLDFFYIIVLILITSLIVMVNRTILFSKYVALFVLLLSIYNVVTVRKNWNLLIVFSFIAYANYSICIANYLSPIKNTIFTSFRTDNSAIVGINILLVFVASLTVCLRIINPMDRFKQDVSFFSDKPNNSIITITATFALIFILIFGFGRPDVDGQRGSPSVYFEYSIIIFILAYYYSSFTAERVCLNILAALYVMTNLIYGGRVTALQIVIMAFLVFFGDKVSVAKVAPYVLCAFIIFYAIGILRTNFTFSIDSLKLTVEVLKDKKFTNDTAYSSYFTSQTFVKVVDMISHKERLLLTIKSILLNIFGGTIVKNGNIAVFTRDYYMHYFGGVFPFFGWFYFGYIGSALFAIYIAYLIKTTLIKRENKGGLNKCLAIYITSTVPRWYLYSPSQAFRGVLLLTCMYALCFIFDNMRKQQGK